MTNSTPAPGTDLTISLEQMALVQQILDPGASYEDYLDGLRESATDLGIELADEFQEMNEETATRLLAHFRKEFLGDQD